MAPKRNKIETETTAAVSETPAPETTVKTEGEAPEEG